MALISNAKGRGEDETPSGYERLFGNRQLGMLMSKVQSAVISTGNELEEFLATRIKKIEGISIHNINKEKIPKNIYFIFSQLPLLATAIIKLYK